LCIDKGHLATLNNKTPNPLLFFRIGFDGSARGGSPGGSGQHVLQPYFAEAIEIRSWCCGAKRNKVISMMMEMNFVLRANAHPTGWTKLRKVVHCASGVNGESNGENVGENLNHPGA
jgi:hypothetical protein